MNLTSEIPSSSVEHRRDFHLQPPVVAASAQDLAQVLRTCGPIPSAAAFLGMALDGLPVLLNLRDPSPGPLLITGDADCDKRRLLQVMARSIDLIHPSGEVTFAVLTDHLREWEALGLSGACEGVLPFEHPLTAGYVRSVAQITRSGRSHARYLLLLIDDLETLAACRGLHEDIHWILETGLSQFVWPIAALTTPHSAALSDWVRHFDTVLCGRSPSSGLAPTHAQAPQFAMLSDNDWLPFWVPEPI